MNTSQVTLVIIAGITQVLGYVGYKNNRWKHGVYYYFFTACAQFFLILGVIPIRFPQATILQRIGAAAILTLFVLVVLYVFRKDLGGPKNN